MLLPSDIARLVLGYLQQEGLSSTSKAFIHESPNLKEYAEHSSDDGAIPACLFSLFGKNLSTILNEYVAAKTKETSQDIPIPSIMTSLWKKLDVTLNQIKSLQNSPTIGHNNRLRVRSANALAHLRRQGMQSVLPAPSTIPGLAMPSIPTTTLAIPGHSTPLYFSSQQPRLSPVCSTPSQIPNENRLLANMKDTTIHVMVPDNRVTPGPVSPGRRKWDSPKRRGGGSSGAGRANMAASSLAAEPQSEEAVTENFPQMVIQNAREKILGDRSLQEKLAENINKILSSDSSPQTSKSSWSAVVPDQSIDEILGLQGEIHMSDDAIHDILEQTESDPAFQALFDLFDCGKGKANEGSEAGGVVESSAAVETSHTGESGSSDPHTFETTAVVLPLEDTRSSQEPASLPVKTKPVQEAKNKRKSVPPSASKTPLGSVRPRKGGSPSRPPAGGDTPAEAPLAAPPALNNEEAAMDVDEAVCRAGPEPPALQEVCEAGRQESHPSSTSPPGTTTSTFETRTTTILNTPTVSKLGNTQGSPPVLTPTGSVSLRKTTTQILPFHLTSVTAASTLVLGQVNKVSKPKANMPRFPTVTSNIEGVSQPRPQGRPLPTATPAATPSLSTETMDPSKMVSLKIIISDEAEEASGDTALTQAVSSISGDKIPTIFLSSPAKEGTPLAVLPGTPTGLDETAQAVSSLQSAEILQPAALSSPLSVKTGGAAPVTLLDVATPMKENTPQQGAQPSYIIQLPLDSASSNFGAATTSYFLITDGAAAGGQAGKMILSSGVPQRSPGPPGSYSLGSPPPVKTYTTASALFLSPVRPMVQSMVFPLSVMGQSNTRNVPVASNQIIAVPSLAQPIVPSPDKHPDPGKPSETAVPGGKTRVPASCASTNPVQAQSSENTGRVAAGTSPGHRRILRFDGSVGTSPSQPRNDTATPPKTLAATTLSSPSPSQHSGTDSPKQARTRPAILGGNRPKRRIETVRCTDNSPSTWNAAESELASPLLLQQKEDAKNPTGSQTIADQDGSSCRDASGRQNTSGRQGASSRQDASGHQDASSRQGGSGRQDASGRQSSSGRQDASSHQEAGSRRQDASSRKNASSCQDASSRKDASSCQVASSRKDAGSCQDASGRKDASSCQDASGRKDAGSCQDASGRKDASSNRQDASSQHDASSRKDASSCQDASGRQEASSSRQDASSRKVASSCQDTCSQKVASSCQDTCSQKVASSCQDASSNRQDASSSRQDASSQHDASSRQDASSSKAEMSQSKKLETRRKSQSTSRKDDSRRRSTDAPSTRSSDHRLRSGSRREKEGDRKQESLEKSLTKGHMGRAERKTQETPVTSNKENQVKGSRCDPAATTPTPRDVSPLPVTPPTPTLHALPSKSPSKTSPLIKQAAEMFQDMQALHPPTTPAKRSEGGCSDLPLPPTPGSGRVHLESLDFPRTPARHRHSRDVEVTPRHLVPPATPELPSCSPASEAGSENSINMAAHTLMILSRAAIARTGTPLKDSLRQDGAGAATPTSSKNRKRKQPEPQVTSPFNELKTSASPSSKKKAKKQRRLLDSFPDDLDVDKFLSSLHYDE